MRLSQFCTNDIQAQNSFTYRAQYIAKKCMHKKKDLDNTVASSVYHDSVNA